MKRNIDSYNGGGGYRGSFPHGGPYPPGFKKYRREDVDPVNPTPSKVLHVRNLTPDTTEADLLTALSPFGNVAYTTLMGNGHMALAEFVTMDEARACIAYSKNHQIMIRNHPVLINYSTSEKIQRSGLEGEDPNKVIVLTISNVAYPITVETLKEICSDSGNVLRIALIKRPGVLQALVEFEDADQATKAKYQLNGADIYDNACTLKVEFGRMDIVKVTANNADQWDYTCDPSTKPENQILQQQNEEAKEKHIEDTDSSWRPGPHRRHEHDSGFGQSNSYGGGGYFPSGDNTYRGRGYRGGRGTSRGGTYIPDDMRQGFFNNSGYESSYVPRGSYRGRGSRGSNSWVERDEYGGHSYGRGGGYSDRGRGRGGYHDRYERDYDHRSSERHDRYSDSDRYNDRHHHHDNHSDDRHHDRHHHENNINGSVVMVYGVDAKEINCDRLFNLLCCYGNCLKIKIMMSKPDTCMVQMGTPKEAASVIEHLQEVELFGNKLSFRPSKQNVVHDVPEPHALSDNSPAFKDYSSSTVHRFNTQEQAAENKIVFPTNELYWQNAPAIVNEDVMKKLFSQKHAPVPVSVKVLNSTPTSSGILSFNDVRASTEALMLCNNMVISGGGNSMPYVFKLSYASPDHRK